MIPRRSRTKTWGIGCGGGASQRRLARSVLVEAGTTFSISVRPSSSITCRDRSFTADDRQMAARAVAGVQQRMNPGGVHECGVGQIDRDLSRACRQDCVERSPQLRSAQQIEFPSDGDDGARRLVSDHNCKATGGVPE